MFLRKPTSFRDKLCCVSLTPGDGALYYSNTQSFKVRNETLRAGVDLLADWLPRRR